MVFPLGNLTATLTVLLHRIYLFLLTLVFLLQRLSLHWVIPRILLSQFPLTFLQTQNWIPLSIIQLMTIFLWIGMILGIIWGMFYGEISLNRVLLWLLLNFESWSFLVNGSSNHIFTWFSAVVVITHKN